MQLRFLTLSKLAGTTSVIGDKRRVSATQKRFLPRISLFRMNFIAPCKPGDRRVTFNRFQDNLRLKRWAAFVAGIRRRLLLLCPTLPEQDFQLNHLFECPRPPQSVSADRSPLYYQFLNGLLRSIAVPKYI